MNNKIDLSNYVDERIKGFFNSITGVIPCVIESYDNGTVECKSILEKDDSVFSDVPVLNLSNLKVEYEKGDFVFLVSCSFSFESFYFGQAAKVPVEPTYGKGNNVFAIPSLLNSGYNDNDWIGVARENDDVEIELDVGELGVHAIPTPVGTYNLNIPAIPTTIRGKIVSSSGKVKIKK